VAPATHAAGAPTIVDAVEHGLSSLPQDAYIVQQPQKKSRRMLPFSIILSLVLIILAGGVWLVSSLLLTHGSSMSQVFCRDLFPPQAFTAATLTPQQAQSLVGQYYCYWNEGDYHLAYNLLGSAYRDQYPWQDPDGPPAFRYSDTSHSDVTDDNVDTSPDGTFQVHITDKATETNGISTYTGYFIVGKDKDGTWRLLEPHLARTGS
jgi:hypothetical protein